MADKRKVSSREFMEQAVELLNTGGKSGNQIEAELGTENGVIYRWARQLLDEGRGCGRRTTTRMVRARCGCS